MKTCKNCQSMVGSIYKHCPNCGCSMEDSSNTLENSEAQSFKQGKKKPAPPLQNSPMPEEKKTTSIKGKTIYENLMGLVYGLLFSLFCFLNKP